MKANEMVMYKTFGTYQLITDDGDRYYDCRHIYSGETCIADTIKEAKKCLDDFEVTAQEIRAAINKLTIYGYRVFKEQEYKDTSTDPNGLKAFARNYVIL